MYLIIKEGKIEYPVDLEKLQKEFPNISFGREIEESFLNDRNVFSVKEVQPPANKKVKELTPVLIDGVYTQQWEVQDFSQEELDEIKLKEIQNIKRRAFLLLKESSWVVIDSSGVINIKEWNDFRKALSDILKSSDPTQIIFPTLPEVIL